MNFDHSAHRRRVVKAGAAAASLFLPAPYAWVWAQSEGALKLLQLPKVALVLGNGAYKDAPALKNPVNDARAIGATLKEIGFEVTLKLDARQSEMLDALQAYAQMLEKRKCVGLFYFAGHGLQLAWHNYLLPVDAAIAGAEDVEKQGVDVDRLVGLINKAANPMNVLILDACRENPFARDFRARSKGLSQMDAPASTLLAYATSPGNVASDGEGANGLYTENLLREIRVPETKIEDVFKRVRLAVRRKSEGQQIPWESTSLEEDFWFIPPKEIKRLSEKEQERLFREELALWERIKASGDPAPLEDYLRRYPSGRFTELAQLQLELALSARGEKKVRIASSAGNPYTKGSATADTAYKIGDSYVYRVLDLRTRAQKSRVASTVTRIADGEVSFESGLVTDLLGNVLRAVDGRRFTPRQQLPLEYAVGRQWHSRFMVTTRQGGDEGVVDLDLKIVTRERIAVPAGTFDAFRIEASGASVFKDRVTDSRITRWMAPDQVRRPIAYEETAKTRTKTLIAERFELESFKQS